MVSHVDYCVGTQKTRHVPKVSPAGAPVLRTYPRGGQSGLRCEHCWSGKTNSVLVKVFLYSNKVKTLCPLSPHENYLCKHLFTIELIG